MCLCADVYIQVPGNIKAHGLLLARDGHAGHFGYHFRVQFIVSHISVFRYGEQRNTMYTNVQTKGIHDSQQPTREAYLCMFSDIINGNYLQHKLKRFICVGNSYHLSLPG